jgi:hypothetical protein
MQESKKENFKVFIGMPCFDKKVFVPCVQSLMNAMKELINNGIASDFSFEVGLPYVSMARNNLIRKFMESDATDFVFIDADLGFPGEAFKELIRANEDVVAGVYPKKQNEELYPVVLKLDENSCVINENGALLASGLPTGFMKIKRHVIEKLVVAYPELAYTDAISGKTTYNFFGTYVKNGRWYGDDYGFCNLWEEIGGKCHVIPNITFIHCGQRNFEGNFNDYLQSGRHRAAVQQ